MHQSALNPRRRQQPLPRNPCPPPRTARSPHLLQQRKVQALDQVGVRDVATQELGLLVAQLAQPALQAPGVGCAEGSAVPISTACCPDASRQLPWQGRACLPTSLLRNVQAIFS